MKIFQFQSMTKYVHKMKKIMGITKFLVHNQTNHLIYVTLDNFFSPLSWFGNEFTIFLKVASFVNLNEFLQFSSRIISYLSIHAYAQMWLLPYAYKKELSPHYKDLMKVAKAATSALTSGGLHVF